MADADRRTTDVTEATDSPESPPSARELAAECHHQLAAIRATVATAESLTGGALGAALSAVPGASVTYSGGVVAYSVEVKQMLLDIPEELLERLGPVHPETAVAMARGVRARLGSTYGVSTTGVAGPRAHGGRPVGTVDVAVDGPDGPVVRSYRFDGDREAVRLAAVRAALDLLRTAVTPPPGGGR